MNGTRDMIFLNDGDIMVVAATGSRSLAFLKRMNHSSTNYTFLFTQTFDSMTPHVLWYVNGIFLYVTSWRNNRIYSLTQVNSTFWQENLFIDASSFSNNTVGDHVTIDECNRFWFAMGSAEFVIFDEYGSYLTTYMTSPTNNVFHVQITENYVLYVSDLGLDQVLRIDPNVSCEVSEF